MVSVILCPNSGGRFFVLTIMSVSGSKMLMAAEREPAMAG